MKYLAALLLTIVSAQCASRTLVWNPNPESNIIGYRLFVGMSSNKYMTNVVVGTNTTLVDGIQQIKYTADLVPGYTYYFSVNAISATGLEGELSDEIAVTVPPSKVTGFRSWAAVDKDGKVMLFQAPADWDQAKALERARYLYGLNIGDVYLLADLAK